MAEIRKIHKKPYRQRKDYSERINAIKRLIEYLRDLDDNFPKNIKKAMLGHAIWQVTVANGDYTPKFRSEGVINGKLGTKIQREHIFEMEKIKDNILSKKWRDFEELWDFILPRMIHCVVTADNEHKRLLHGDGKIDGLSRYKEAGIKVWDCSKEPPELLKEIR